MLIKLKLIWFIITADPLEIAVIQSMPCYIKGRHKWVSDFDPKKEIEKPISQRVYCKHCGLIYGSAKYHH